MEVNGRDRRKQQRLSIDRLSELPDAILCHFLSFLPTKASVATSILAKRWSLTIKVENCVKSQVKKWITTAIDRNVECLHLNVEYHKPLPFRLFACDTLVELRLFDCGVITTLDDVCLPRLKKLYLENVDFEDDESLPCLLSGCSVLEHFLIQANDEVHLKSCYVSSPTVKWLYVTSLLSYIGRRNQGHRLEINVPAVEYLTVHDSLSGPIECGDLTSLVTADISHDYDDRDEEETLCSVSMLRFVDGLCKVKCLILDLSSCDAMIPDCLLSLWHPSFNNLTQLKLAADSRFLSKFLENANNLEICEFRKCERPTGWSWTKAQLELQSNGWIELKQVPKCLLSCLITIKVIETVCTEEGLEIVRYLLRNAKILKKMDIEYLRKIDSREKKNLLQKISLFERGSEACELCLHQASF